MRIYISGPINGHDDAREQFKEAEEKLIALGHEVVNPAELDKAIKLHFNDYDWLRLDFGLIDMCEAIVQLEDWEYSAGANAEYGYAVARGKLIYTMAALGL